MKVLSESHGSMIKIKHLKLLICSYAVSSYLFSPIMMLTIITDLHLYKCLLWYAISPIFMPLSVLSYWGVNLFGDEGTPLVDSYDHMFYFIAWVAFLGLNYIVYSKVKTRYIK